MVGFSFDGPASPFSFFTLAIVAIILVASWVILAGSRFVQGGVVERPERVPQLYGYTVCLIALIIGLASLMSVVESGLTLSNPAYATRDAEWSGWAEPSVTSFEAFRATYDRARELRAGPDARPPEPVAEPELRRRYEALRADRLERARAQAQRSLLTGSLGLVLGAALFLVHWRWLRRKVEVMRNAWPA
ncbi:MAG TPA: hypothetical protein VFS05_15945 [Gemmatimonadaceae bacterium]|nr:hypothetical protein [Gemmatimonadaceae bacterium]